MLLEGGSPALHARLAALKGVSRRHQQVGLLVRALPGRVRSPSSAYPLNTGGAWPSSASTRKIPTAPTVLAFLKSFPVSYPSYYDKSGALGLQLTDSTFRPATVFIPAHGRPYIREGEYPSAAKLKRDVQRYALDR